MTEQDLAFVFDLAIGHGVGGGKPKAFKEGLIDEDALEAWPGVLDESIKDGEGAELPMDVAVLSVGADLLV